MARIEGDADLGARRLVLVHGRDQARQMVEPQHKGLVDIAAEVMGADDSRIGISYAGFCLTGLPHKKLADDASWEKRGHRVTLLIEPGKMKLGKGPAKLHGVPYGARARMILLYLQTQAVRTGSREVELGRSMRDWMGRMGLSWGGETGRALREQATRIAACSLKFFWDADSEDARTPWQAARFVSSGLTFADAQPGDPRQAGLFDEWVKLDETFFTALQKHPVPLREASLRQLSDRSTSLDVYIWLAYRLHTIKGRTPIRWTALREQFGTNYAENWSFKRDFQKALSIAVAAYPEARVEVEDEGVVLYPSMPAVAPRLIAAGGLPR